MGVTGGLRGSLKGWGSLKGAGSLKGLVVTEGVGGH